ncbi:MAG: hypothetical protein WC842_01920 [Candidatus Paceibacterota bacterium]|jgi:hypothetical protein
MRIFFSLKSGSILIEAIVGLMLIIVSFGGIISLISRGLQLNVEAKNKFVATYLAAEGIEIVKASLDTNWIGVKPGMYEFDYTCKEIGKAPCANAIGSQATRSNRKLYRTPDGIYQYSVSMAESPFMRSVIINANTSAVTVNSIVQWVSSGEIKEVQISDTFMKWR